MKTKFQKFSKLNKKQQEQVKGGADIKKLADELVNLTVKEVNEI